MGRTQQRVRKREQRKEETDSNKKTGRGEEVERGKYVQSKQVSRGLEQEIRLSIERNTMKRNRK